MQETILIDRLFHANGNPAAGMRPPAFPFERVTVTAVKQTPAVAIVAVATPSVVNTR